MSDPIVVPGQGFVGLNNHSRRTLVVQTEGGRKTEINPGEVFELPNDTNWSIQ